MTQTGPLDATPIAAILRDVSWCSETRRGAGLNDLRLILHEGEHLGLVGAPGAGRAALLRLLAGRLRGWTGIALVLGHALSPDRPAPRRRRRLVALLGRSTDLVGCHDVARNVALGRLPHQGLVASLIGRLSARDRRAIDRAIEETGIAGLRGRRAGALDPGAARLVALARCLAQEPRLLLVDLMAEAADPMAEDRQLRLITTIARARRITLVFACHHPDLALRHASRVLLMRNGRAVLSAAPGQLDAAERAQVMRLGGPRGQARLRLVI
ncbi:MAG: ABC transporter ATP-binding protein [Alphaproteobacteria bacterium]|nr:MAG: ABC transporter ATP-binding protein [Alphaproteobacteria bacterium]